MSLFMTRGSLILASLAFSCKAASEQLSSFGTICGDTRIFKLFAQDDGVDAARNVNFAEIKQLMGKRKTEFQNDVDKEVAKIKEYQAEIDKLKGSGTPPPMDQTATDTFISKTINVQAAKESGCLEFETITAKFAEAAKTYFTSAHQLNGGLFIKRVQALVGMDEDCDMLAEELLPIAVQASAKSYKPSNSNDWLDKQNEAEKKRKEAAEQLSQCQAAQKSLEEFEAAMKDRTEDEQARGDNFRNIKKKLNDASDDLDDMEAEAETLKEGLNKALEKLNGDDKTVKDAKTSLEKCKQGEAELQEKLFKTTTKFEMVTKKLHKFRKANDVVEELRDAVSMTTEKMWLLFEEAALKPLMTFGLSQHTDLKGYFHPTTADIPGLSQLGDSVKSLVTFCKEEATPAFAKVKGVKNLPSLCATGEEGEIMDGLKKCMSARRDEVTLLLKGIQTWFNPLKGQKGLTEEDVTKRVEAGEPTGLRKVIGTYSRSTFYKGYLQNWTLKGKFLALISQLEKAVEALTQLYDSLKDEVASLPALVHKAVEDRKVAQTKLADATKALQASEAEKKKLTADLQEQMQLVEKMDQQVMDLEKKLKEARQAWTVAKETLVSTYKAGIAFIEEAEEVEEIASPEALLEQA